VGKLSGSGSREMDGQAREGERAVGERVNWLPICDCRLPISPLSPELLSF
jgi:hypothetical protein